jgi:hypothetical protein
MRSRISKAVFVLALIFAGFVIAIRFDVFTPAAPAGWAQVHIGMSRDDVLRLAGAPSVSGWPEKVVETWQRNGAICHHRLFVGYDGQQATRVCDGTWLRGYGWLHPRIESK